VIVVANLDAEAEIAGLPISDRALRLASALGTLLRVLAVGRDARLWTPRPVDPARLPDVPGLPRPALVSGPLASLEPSDEVVAWAETPAVLRLRGRAGGSVLPTVAHRRFALDLARRLGHDLPGAAIVRSPTELRERLAAGATEIAPDGRWVLKAPYAAAGRWRLFDGAGEAEIEGFFRRFGEGLLEPWLRRTADGGVAAEVGADGGVSVVGAHEQTVDERGRFLGVGPFREATVAEREVATSAGDALARAGHRGPFGIDTWQAVDREGRGRRNLLGEINARLTMGRVAREIAGRVEGERLRVGRSLPDRPGVVPLLLPGPHDPTAAWIE
jgi:hypothetical protein